MLFTTTVTRQHILCTITIAPFSVVMERFAKKKSIETSTMESSKRILVIPFNGVATRGKWPRLWPTLIQAIYPDNGLMFHPIVDTSCDFSIQNHRKQMIPIFYFSTFSFFLSLSLSHSILDSLSLFRCLLLKPYHMMTKQPFLFQFLIASFTLSSKVYRIWAIPHN